MEAIILAGGLGKRLRTVVADVPTPMAPIRGKPFLDYQLAYWHGQGVGRFILSVGYKWNVIQDHFGGAFRGAPIDYCVEPEPLGTGGGFLLSLKKIKSAGPALLLNGDTMFSVKLAELEKFHQDNGADVTLALATARPSGLYAGLELGRSGKVKAFGRRDADAGGAPLANGGVTLFNPAAFAKISWDGTAQISLEDDIWPRLLKGGKKIFGCPFQAPFIDIGAPDSYKLAETVIS